MDVLQSTVWEMPHRREPVYSLLAGGRVRNWLPKVTTLSCVSDVHMFWAWRHAGGSSIAVRSTGTQPSPRPACLLAACGRVRRGWGLPCLTWKEPNTKLTALLRVPPTHRAVPGTTLPIQMLSSSHQLLMAAGEADGAKAKLSAEYRECEDSGFQATDAASYAQTPEGAGFSPPVCGGWAICGEVWWGAVDGGLWNRASWGLRRLQSELRIYYIISPTSSTSVSSVQLFPMTVQFKYHLSITVCNHICGSGCTFLF